MSEDTASTVLLPQEALAPECVWAGIRGIFTAMEVTGGWDAKGSSVMLYALESHKAISTTVGH